MPCHDYSSVPNKNDLELASWRQSACDAKDALDEVTRHLCAVCGSLEKANYFEGYASEGLQKWWYNHKKLDAQRESLAKLSEKDEDSWQEIVIPIKK